MRRLVLVWVASCLCGLSDPVLALDAPDVTLKERLTGFQAGAHRGGMLNPWNSGNTLPNFENAQRDAVDVLEMDLWVSSDGVVFVYHDRGLDPKTNCVGRIAHNPAQRIHDLCRYNWTHDRIPTFREVLEWAATRTGPRGHLVLDAEFKNDEVIEPALALVAEFHARDWVYFQTQTSRKKYGHARLVDPRVALVFTPKNEADVDWALSLNDPNLLVIEVHGDNGTERDIARIHAAGKLVSENSFHRGSELFGARCDEVFADGIDIAISNRTESCVRQRSASAARVGE